MAFTGIRILLALAVMAAISVILWLPVINDRLTAMLSRTSKIWAPTMIVIGSVLLAIGLTNHIGKVAIAGGSMVGAVVAAFLYDNY